MSVIGYCRVSSREQAANSEALDQQKARVLPHCDRLIVDVESGSSRSRPGFKELEKLIEAGKCSTVVCTRIDRLTRSLSHLQRFLDLVTRSGTTVRCLDDNFDLTTAAGRFHANIIGSVAEMESAMLSERIRHGWAYFRQQKKVHSAPFGYKINEAGRLVLDHDPVICLLANRQELSRYQIARQLVEWYLDPPADKNGKQRRSLRRTVALFNETYGIQSVVSRPGRASRGQLRLSCAGLQDWLNNPTLQGHTSYLRRKKKSRPVNEEPTIFENTHEPIVTKEEAQAIAATLEGNKAKRFSGNGRAVLPVSGLVYCACCRARCRSENGKRSNPPGYNYYYQCSRWGIRACTNRKMVRMEKIEWAIIDALTSQAQAIADDYQDSPSNLPVNPKILEIEESLVALEKLPYNFAIEQSKAALRNEIRELKLAGNRALADKTDKELMLKGYSDRQFWMDASAEDKAELYPYFIKSVWIDGGEVVGVDFQW